MGWRDRLRVPKIHFRKRSKARSDVVAGSTEGPSGVDPAEPRPMASNPELGVRSPPLPTPGPSTPSLQEHNGMRIVWTRMIPLMTLLPRNADSPSTSDPSALVPSEGKREHPGSSGDSTSPGAIDKKKPNLKSLASSTAKQVLRGIKESADAFPPLKSVAGFLCFVLDNYEVQCGPHITKSSGLTLVPEHHSIPPNDRVLGTSG